MEAHLDEALDRLAVWFHRRGAAFLRICAGTRVGEERIREALVARLKADGVPFSEQLLPPDGAPHERAGELLQALEATHPALVLVRGFPAVATEEAKALAEALSWWRDPLARAAGVQIWLMPTLFSQALTLRAPDLDSWFRMRLEVDEPPRQASLASPPQRPGRSAQAARAIAADLMARMRRAVDRGDSPWELERTLAWPAVQALRQAGLEEEAQEVAQRAAALMGVALGPRSSLTLTHLHDTPQTLLSRGGPIQGRSPAEAILKGWPWPSSDPDHEAPGSAPEPVAGATAGAREEAAPAQQEALAGEASLTLRPAREANRRADEVALTFTRPHLIQVEGAPRIAAACVARRGDVATAPFPFIAPLGAMELDDLRWYVERWPHWPLGERQRAKGVLENLRPWGHALFQATLGRPELEALLVGWLGVQGSRRLVAIEVAPPGHAAPPTWADPWGDVVTAPVATYAEAERQAATLFSLPWELMADDQGFLAEGPRPAPILRRFGASSAPEPIGLAGALRVLVIVSRPEIERDSLIDPRACSQPLAEALAPLGRRAEISLLAEGSLSALRQALEDAAAAGRPYSVVHFDGRGGYDSIRETGILCFEDDEDARAGKLQRRLHLVDAEQLGDTFQGRPVPLVVLGSGGTAQAREGITRSVPAQLLEAGVGSVIAMSHDPLVETVRRFTAALYGALAEGQPVGGAVLQARRALMESASRGSIGWRRLELSDWFVPLLFQQPGADAALLPERDLADPEATLHAPLSRQGDLPAEPPHGFIGRGRALVDLWRLLAHHRRVALVARGGEGKTAVMVEAARWLLGLGRFEGLAYVSVEHERAPSWQTMLDALGRQLVPGYSVATTEGTGEEAERQRQARLPIEAALKERRVALLIDNLETLLPGGEGTGQAPEDLEALLSTLRALSEVGETRLLLTAREPPPVELGAELVLLPGLSEQEGVELVAHVLGRLDPAPDDEVAREQVEALVRAVGAHARSLILLTPLLVERGAAATTEAVTAAMAELERAHPGERERSLVASVRLSLGRLPPQHQEQARGMQVFRGAVHVQYLARVLGVEDDDALGLCRALVAVGLATAEGPWLMPDPALGVALALEPPPPNLEDLEERRLEAGLALLEFLGRQLHQDPAFALQGARIFLEEALALLDAAEAAVKAGGLNAEVAVGAAGSLEQLADLLGLQAITTQVAAQRRRMGAALGAWGRGRFESARQDVERLWGSGDVQGALRAAEALVAQAEAAGDGAYPTSAYDRATAHLVLARLRGAAGHALEQVEGARRARDLFLNLAHAGDQGAAAMAAKALSEEGNGLAAVGRLEEAAAAYVAATGQAEEVGDSRAAAVSRGQLGTVRYAQGRLEEAWAALERSRSTFESIGDLAAVATSWHQIGNLHHQAGRWDAAEDAYQRALAIWTRLGSQQGRASTLSQLGSLYGHLDRFEEAATFYQMACDSFASLGDRRSEAIGLSNLGNVLLQLRRLDEARAAVRRAIALNEPYGHAPQPWASWSILADVERAAGDPEAAAKARARSRTLYRAYRRDGGEPTDGLARTIAAAGQAAAAGIGERILAQLPEVETSPKWVQPVVAAARTLAAGRWDPAVVDDPRIMAFLAEELALAAEAAGLG